MSQNLDCVLLAAAQFNILVVYQHLGGICCLHLQGWSWYRPTTTRLHCVTIYKTTTEPTPLLKPQILHLTKCRPIAIINVFFWAGRKNLFDIDSLYVKFVGYNPKALCCRHVCVCWLTNTIPCIIFRHRYVYGLPPYRSLLVIAVTLVKVSKRPPYCCFTF
jgi:hypothetical protein